MSAVWLPPAALAERRAAAAGPLAPLADSLARDLDRAIALGIHLPREKARLSRTGGRCPRDGTLLRFDPASPRRHACPACGAAYDDDAHHRWWIMGYHLWLAERAVHAAVLHALRGAPAHAAHARAVLAACADAYLGWPNADNVLGPTRPFFSTYLESIWLLQLCVALDLLEGAGADDGIGAAVRDRLVAPSAALVAGYDEGDSNRQVWNDAALLAAALLLGDRRLAERAVHGPSGIAALLERALLADGSWYEGENYHLFAHRGLWYGVRLAAAAPVAPIPAPLLARFDEGFATPFLTALPDLTFPARRDSQYGVSLRQWRFAELAELGLARRPDDRRLRHALARLYDGAAPAGDSGRWRSTAEAERNEPAVALTRADLGWRALLHALPTLPDLPPPSSAIGGAVLLPAQGLAILRGDGGTTHAALDYGASGGGHGHPDRLGVTLAAAGERWLDDPGTGSYVDASLHWYRSTLAHHAPLVNGRSQPQADGRLHAFEARGGAGWADASVHLAEQGVALRRAIVLLPGYLVDELTWTADAPVDVALPLHVDAEAPAGPWVRDALDVEHASYLRDVERLDGPAASPLALGRPGRDAPVAWIAADGQAAWWRATAPGAPGRPPRRLHLVRAHGAAGRLRLVWSWRGEVLDVEPAADALTILLRDGARHAHRRSPHGWHVDLAVRGARSSLDLGGARADPPPAAAPPPPWRAAALPPPPSEAAPLRATLGEDAYRRSEPTWAEAGRPTADLSLRVADGELRLDVAVRAHAPHVVPAGAVNDMDNERAEVNGDGVQLHVALAGAAGAPAAAGWLLLPDVAAARVVPLDGAGALPAPAVRCEVAADGYRLAVALPLDALRAALGVPRAAALGVGVLVNESAPGRERRRGQLVLGGARGEFVYLRGDRHDPSRFLWFLAPDV